MTQISRGSFIEGGLALVGPATALPDAGVINAKRTVSMPEEKSRAADRDRTGMISLEG
jgi:hypothetical protein